MSDGRVWISPRTPPPLLYFQSILARVVDLLTHFLGCAGEYLEKKGGGVGPLVSALGPAMYICARMLEKEKYV